MELKKRIMTGMVWNSAASLGINILNFITKVVIARILFPEDFGLFAMAFILINFLSIFIGLGIVNALIYKKDDYEKTKNTAFVLSIITGLFLFVISLFSSTFIASFFEQPELSTIIRVMSVILLFDSVSSILNGILLKALEFKRKAVVEFLSIIIYSGTVILLGLNGFGVWSLVWAYIVQHGSVMVVSWLLIKERPKLLLDKERAKELLAFGKYVISTSILSWAVTSIDNIIVGKKLGEEPLGYYSMAFNVVTLPVVSFTHLITTIFYPVYAKLQDDKERLKKAYLKPLEWSLVGMLPVAAFLFFIPERIIFIILGQKWIALVPLLKIFAVYCMFRTVCTIISHLLDGVGKPKVASGLLAAELAIIGVFIIPGIMFAGLGGVALVIVCARGISAFLHICAVQKIMTITLQEYKDILLRKLFAAGSMCLALFTMDKVFYENTLFNFVIIIAIGSIVYLSLLYMMERRLFRELLEHVKMGVEK